MAQISSNTELRSNFLLAKLTKLGHQRVCRSLSSARTNILLLSTTHQCIIIGSQLVCPHLPIMTSLSQWKRRSGRKKRRTPRVSAVTSQLDCRRFESHGELGSPPLVRAASLQVHPLPPTESTEWHALKPDAAGDAGWSVSAASGPGHISAAGNPKIRGRGGFTSKDLQTCHSAF